MNLFLNFVINDQLSSLLSLWTHLWWNYYLNKKHNNESMYVAHNSRFTMVTIIFGVGRKSLLNKRVGKHKLYWRAIRMGNSTDIEAEIWKKSAYQV
jgi:hypothetical protein